MGQYTEGSIMIECKSNKSAKKIVKAIQNLDEYIASKMDGKPFNTSVSHVDHSDSTIDVSLASNRYSNAEWQCHQILELVKEKFKGEVNTFTADLTTPENIIYEDFEDGEED